MSEKRLTTTEKIHAILNDGYDINGQYNMLCALSLRLERQRRYDEQYQVDAAIADLRKVKA